MMNRFPRIVAAAYLALFVGVRCEAGQDKSEYTLFKPTPPGDMRSLNSDRPSVTTGPYTVDAGHLQFEASFLQYTHDYAQGRHADSFDVMPTNCRVGLTSQTEIDLLIDPYQNVASYSPAQTMRFQGFGDTTLQGKLNIWGNDGGASAFGIISFAKLPTGAAGISNHHVEGGVILPISVALTDGLSLAGMAEFSIDRNASNTGCGWDMTDTLVLTKTLTPSTSVYVEYVGVAPIQAGRSFAASVDLGAAFQLNDNLQLDIAGNIGLSKSLPEFTILSGITIRI